NNCATVSPNQTTIYTLRAAGSGTKQEQSLTVTVVPRGKIVVGEFIPSRRVIAPGEKVDLCYQVTGADAVGIETDGQMMSYLNNFGKRTCLSVAPRETTTYALVASAGNADEIVRRTTVEVVKFQPFRITQITVKPNPVPQGDSAQLCVTVSGGTKPFNVKFVPFGNTISRSIGQGDQACVVIRPTQTTEILVTAVDARGLRGTGETTVEVQQPPLKQPRIVSFRASPAVVAPGEKASLCYEVENADGVTLSSRPGGVRISRVTKVREKYKTTPIIAQQSALQLERFYKGSKDCIPVAPARTTIYTITATNDSGKRDSRSVTVTVQEPPGRNDSQPQPPSNAGDKADGTVTTGTLEGQVVDESKTPLPGATISVTNADNGLIRTAVTGRNGDFRLVALPAGNYKVTVTLVHYRVQNTVVTIKANSTTVINAPQLTLRRTSTPPKSK